MSVYDHRSCCADFMAIIAYLYSVYTIYIRRMRIYAVYHPNIRSMWYPYRAGFADFILKLCLLAGERSYSSPTCMV